MDQMHRSERRNPYLTDSSTDRISKQTVERRPVKKKRNSSSSKYKKRRRRTHFYRNLFLFFFIIFSMISFFFVRLWNYLSDYQSTLPTVLCDQILEAYKNNDISTLKKYCKNLPVELQDDLVFHNYLNDILDKNNLFYYEDSNNIDTKSITYNICSANQKFATLKLSANGETSKYGFQIYKISFLEQYSLGNTTYIQSPGTTFLINGNSLPDSYITEQTEEASVFSQIGAGPFYTTTYVLPDYYSASSVTCISQNGENCSVIWNEEHNTCRSENQVSKEEIETISSFAEKAAKEYAVFATVKFAPRDALLPYLMKDTVFYKAIKTYDNDWGITKTADSFDQVKVDHIICYSPSEYSCIVSLDYRVKQGANEKTFPLSFTCYIAKRDGTLKVVNLETNDKKGID